MAARFSASPAVVAALLDGGADPLAWTDFGETAWYLIQDNDTLRDTVVYERLRGLLDRSGE